MPPNYENRTRSPSTSLQFIPSLTCIAEEEPRLIAIRRIFVPDGIEVEIPIFDVNIYAPEIPKPPLSDSYKRLLKEMEQFIENNQNAERYKEMTEDLRQKIVIEHAESERLTKQFTNREWYWYSEQTKRFIDKAKDEETQENKTKIENFEDGQSSKNTVTALFDNSEFDLNAEF
uniref:Uncharacterized protein n=1 Tax=Caenorhabditis tropicalis TaxID=1561998 RepID=A0A1I7UXU9_9PELO